MFRLAKTKHSQEHMETEIHLLNYLASRIHVCQIPKIEFNFSKDYCFGYKKINGNPLTKELYETLSPQQKENLAGQLAEFLIELHASMPASIGSDMRLENTDWPLSANTLADKLKLNNEAINPAQFSLFLADYRQLETESPALVVHNDLHGDNILIDTDTKKLAGIIDFSATAIGNAYHEFRYLHLIDIDLVRLALNAYNKRSHANLTLKHAYIYCLATEFSRLSEAVTDQNQEKINSIKQRIDELSKFIFI